MSTVLYTCQKLLLLKQTNSIGMKVHIPYIEEGSSSLSEAGF